MSKTLQHYNAAQRDIRLNSFPYRQPDGTYQWSIGQLSIMNEPQFNELRVNSNEIDHLQIQVNLLRSQMLIYQTPAGKIEQEGEKLKDTWEPEIAEEELTLKTLKSDLQQYDEDMLNRGFYIYEEKDTAPTKPIEEKKKSKGINWRTILGFFGIWFGGEIFMTYVQWHSLRDDRNVEDLIVRSLSFGLILFLIHFVAHRNKTHKKMIYSIFLWFNLLMLFTMLFASPILNKVYPEDNNAQSISEQWSINATDDAGKESIKTDYPFLVEFYRSNEVMPAILCFLFFVAMQSFIHKKEKQVTVPNPEPEIKGDSAQVEINRKRNHFLTKIRESEGRLNELRTKQKEILRPNTGSLKDILNQLETKSAEVLSIEKSITSLKSGSETILKMLEKELDEYRIEFQDVLRNDRVKSEFVTPEWPNRNDTLNYFKIK